MGYLHHDQIFDVTIAKQDYDIKNLITMQKSRGLLAHLNWTCGQGKCVRFDRPGNQTSDLPHR